MENALRNAGEKFGSRSNAAPAVACHRQAEGEAGTMNSSYADTACGNRLPCCEDTMLPWSVALLSNVFGAQAYGTSRSIGLIKTPRVKPQQYRTDERQWDVE